ncbi:histidine phosphatase family protein [Xanthomonadaceae bacterium JHOS43]|nr:histidine phosphatase family protein [Xanthomonadaceae bacterium JHOS43]
MSDSRWLILLRHAHAEPADAGQHDRDRPLSDTGEAEAEAAAAFLATFGIQPGLSRVVCSPAARATETAARVLEKLGYVDTRHDPRIYEASPGDLLNVLDDHADVPTLMLVGHNPGLEHLVALLSTGRSGECRGMPPAGVAVLRLPADAAIEPGSAELAAFWSP